MEYLKFKIKCDDFRSLPLPGLEDKKIKLGTMFVKAEDIPDELREWVGVNPRSPKMNKVEKLSGKVSRTIVKTLTEEPEKFALKNLGIYLSVDSMESTRVKGNSHEVEVVLNDKMLHGIVNGGHTFQAIRQVKYFKEYDEGAYVRLHIYQNLDSESIVDLADGLNNNLQVDDKSLENLQGSFDNIRQAMEGKKGADKIAYKDGDDGEVDILEVLHLLSLLDLNKYPNNKQPNDIFGRKKKVLDYYSDDIKKTSQESSFERLIPFTFEVLKLSEEIQKASIGYFSRNKVNNKKTGNRVSSDAHKKDALFTDGEIRGLIPQGWLYPMVSAFRANLKQSSWDSGKLEWLEDPKDLINEIIEDMASNIKELNFTHKNKPAEVGRKATAYQVCFSFAFSTLAMKGKIGLTS
ncbi:hypothetical protein PI2015_3144 [Pseudoalteromonas issachenkonii]|uniref:Abortive phage infection protein C-terminal domain-containing protein n=1 Tax=Pseudoalteromonas issachenkonii TaxID=152297 RepID=A0ABM6N7X2_9GAMM|nr:AIPR family protein [Pseudoalteromonas issachenkonii]ALQ56392.1 hypothetical protein PI2015_3144 [Pseudoalteromonas issachenkonii]ATC92320.1 hypothetical protein PISS_b0134 [Pseudoalteromonas issachenkonii]